MSMKLNNNQRGSIIVSILVISIFLSTFIFSLMVLANQNLVRSKQRLLLLQAQYAAESGADSAIAQLNAGVAYTGTTSDTMLMTAALYRATYSVSVVAGSNSKEKIITATGKVYSPVGATTPTYTRSIEVIAQRTSSTTTSAMLSRNILATGSSVKDIKAKDIYVNGYITLTKNTNNLIAENIYIGDKNTGATNCSLGGSGSLTKPTSFSTPGQTKTKLNFAYNNCISPPGNTSNGNFDVFVNQSTISKIQSTNIPWSQYMDNSYQNSPGGCSDWTTGSSPRSIPSTGNTKKTHYPDNGGGVINSCGTSGNLNLGSNTYTIRDHTHIRANFCSAAACSPTFNNPDAGSTNIKFIFVEGSVNFDQVITSPGSGPIVLVVYGTDPASKASACPYGGAFFLGNGNTNAPAMYILATNGVCLDKSKFSANPALGGFSGKNIYIDSNSGTPFDLHTDTSFPVDQIPVDLAWRATRYRRL